MNQFKFAHKQGLGPMNLEDIDIDELWTAWVEEMLPECSRVDELGLGFAEVRFRGWLVSQDYVDFEHAQHPNCIENLLELFVSMGLVGIREYVSYPCYFIPLKHLAA